MIISKQKLYNLENELTKAIQKLPKWQKNKKYLKILNKKKFQLFADIEINKIIKKIIYKNIGKNIEILSEENKFKTSKILRKKIFCIIDPIDGTRSFYNQYKGYVSQVCIVQKNKIIFSYIYAPSLKYKWVNIHNIFFFNDKKIFSNKSTYKGNPRIIDNYSLPRGLSKKLMTHLKTKKYIECGSISLKIMLIFNDSADILIKDIIFKIWDIAPTVPWLNNSKIYIKNFDFKKICLNQINYDKGLLVFQKKYLENIKIFLKKYEKK